MKEKRKTCPACEHNFYSLENRINGYEMVRCKRCDLLFAFEVPTKENLGNIYDDVYHRLDNYKVKIEKLKKYIEYLQNPKGWGKLQILLKQLYFSKKIPRNTIPFGFDRHRLLKKISLKKGDKLLEVGCGSGQFLLSAKTLGWEVEGIDISENIIKESNPIHGLNTRAGTLEDLFFKKKSYKAIVAWEVLEHLIDPKSFLLKVKKLMQSDGLFACSVPNTSLKKVRFHYNKPGPASLPPIHLNFWTCESFRIFAEINGFQIIYLAPNVLLNSQKGWNNSYSLFFLYQIASFLGIKEGPNIYALLRPI